MFFTHFILCVPVRVDNPGVGYTWRFVVVVLPAVALTHLPEPSNIGIVNVPLPTEVTEAESPKDLLSSRKALCPNCEKVPHCWMKD